jgi:hypothetical protein
MKKNFISTLFFILFLNLANGQNTFFIGSKTYPCTESFLLSPSNNNPSAFNNGLTIIIAKNGEAGMIALSYENSGGGGGGLRVKGNISIYLDNGTIISCTDRNKFDYVDGIATTVYYLTKDEIFKMKNSNVNSIRYSLKCIDCQWATNEGNYSVSNKQKSNYYSVTEKINISNMIEDLFDN